MLIYDLFKLIYGFSLMVLCFGLMTACLVTWYSPSKWNISKIFILDKRLWNRAQPRSLVKISANWKWDFTWRVWTSPRWIFSWTKWQSSSICFVRSWYTGLAAMWMTALLSQNRRAGWGCKMWKSLKRENSHINSQHVEAMDRYSNLAEKRETVYCFLDFYDTKESPKNTY